VSKDRCIESSFDFLVLSNDYDVKTTIKTVKLMCVVN
jgi:hypothetical protein